MMRSVGEELNQRVAVRMTERQRRRLERLAAETRMSPSDVLRQLIDTAEVRPMVFAGGAVQLQQSRQRKKPTAAATVVAKSGR